MAGRDAPTTRSTPDISTISEFVENAVEHGYATDAVVEAALAETTCGHR